MRQILALTLACVAFVGSNCLSAELPNDPLSVNAVAAVTLPDDPLKFAMLEVRREVLPRVSLAAGAVYMSGAGNYEEAQLRLAAIWSRQMGMWALENRHMLSLSEEAKRYRCRLRLTRSLSPGPISLRAFDEVYADRDHGVVRNNLALGFGARIGSGATLEFYHVWVNNRDIRNDKYALVLLTVRL